MNYLRKRGFDFSGIIASELYLLHDRTLYYQSPFLLGTES